MDELTFTRATVKAASRQIDLEVKTLFAIGRTKEAAKLAKAHTTTENVLRDLESNDA